MTIAQEQTQEFVSKFARHDNDTGSPDVQVESLSKHIKELTEHLKIHKKDFSSRRGLINMVGQRRRLLRYLRKNREETYLKLIKDLKLKHI